MAKNNKNDKNITELLDEAGLNSVYRNYIKRIDKGLLGGNKAGDILSRETFSQAEKAFLDPQISTCFLLLAFSLMKKKLVFKSITEGKKREINKSKDIADMLNFSLKKLKDGGVRQLQFDLMTSKFFGFSLIEKVYDILNQEQSSKYQDYYYYRACKAKRPGLWDFVYDDNDNIIGYRSLLNKTKVWSTRKFLRLTHLPLFNNPNGTADFERVWRFWDAKVEFIIFLLTLGSRLQKGRQTILQNTGTNGNQSPDSIEGLLEDLTNNLSVYIPPGFEVNFSNFDVGAIQYFLAVLRWLDSQIAIAMIGSSLSVNESQGAGTNAQSTVHNENKYTFQEYMEGIMCDCFDEDYAADLIKLNYDLSQYPEEMWPHAELELPDNEKPLDKVSLDKILKDMGVLDTDTETDLNYLREKYNLPDKPELFAKVEEILNNAINGEPKNLTQDNPVSDNPENQKDINNIAELYI